MHPARAKAKQTQALVETAASVDGLKAGQVEIAERLDRIEAMLAELAAPKAPKKEK